MEGHLNAAAPELRVDQDRALEFYRQGSATFVDVRSPASFEREHVVGALSIPIEELSRRMGEIPQERTVITYCA